jgi:hypothetical protein
MPIEAMPFDDKKQLRCALLNRFIPASLLNKSGLKMAHTAIDVMD